jgi:TatD DNase family protein
VRVRVNTDGLANLVHDRDVAAELVGAVDALSVSLNGHDAATHARLCPSVYGERGFEAVCAFLRRSVELFDDVTASVVASTGVDVDAAGRLADSIGARLRVRG